MVTATLNRALSCERPGASAPGVANKEREVNTMKNKLFALFLATMAALEVYACFNPVTETQAQEAETTETVTTEDDYINMNDVVDFEATETGLMLHFSDGTGYWWER